MFLHDKILKGFDKGLMTGMILVDLQKAFDTIDRDILLKKLSVIGDSNHIIGWFKSYFSNRLFRMNLENCYSDPYSTVIQYYMWGTTRVHPGTVTASHTHERHATGC